MNRLTIRNSDGAWDVPLRNDDGVYIPSQEVIDRLAEYEEAGLEPEEVERYAKAEKEGRLVVLPCEVGDTVYYHFQFKNKRVLPFTRKAKVKNICCNRKTLEVDVELMDAKESGIMKTFHAEDFGKTVFPTRKDAEMALEGMKNDE